MLKERGSCVSFSDGGSRLCRAYVCSGAGICSFFAGVTRVLPELVHLEFGRDAHRLSETEGLPEGFAGLPQSFISLDYISPAARYLLFRTQNVNGIAGSEPRAAQVEIQSGEGGRQVHSGYFGESLRCDDRHHRLRQPPNDEAFGIVSGHFSLFDGSP